MLPFLVVACAFGPAPGSIALHISVTPSEIDLLPSVARRVVWPLQQCFSSVVVAVDQPGGKTYSNSRNDPPRYITPHNVTVNVHRVQQLMGQTMRLLRTKCKRVELIIDLGGHAPYFTDPPTHPEDEPAFADNPSLPSDMRFFKNTVMYTRALVETTADYIVHADIDTTGLTVPPVATGRSALRAADFVLQAVRKLEKDEKLLFVMPGRHCDKAHTIPYTMSCRLFVSMPARFKTMLPLRYWASHVEDMMRYNMQLHNFTGIMLEGSRPCVASTYLARWLFSNVLYV